MQNVTPFREPFDIDLWRIQVGGAHRVIFSGDLCSLRPHALAAHICWAFRPYVLSDREPQDVPSRLCIDARKLMATTEPTGHDNVTGGIFARSLHLRVARLYRLAEYMVEVFNFALPAHNHPIRVHTNV
jgi:hypothetical protein